MKNINLGNKAISLIIVTVVLFIGGCQTVTERETVRDSAKTEVPARKPKTADSETKNTFTGNFEGKSDHKTSGEAVLEQNGNGYRVILNENFDFDGAPAPIVALGKDGYKKDTNLGKLKANKGRQVYEVPASIDAGGPNEVWIWCTKFDVPLGVAKLSN